MSMTVLKRFDDVLKSMKAEVEKMAKSLMSKSLKVLPVMVFCVVCLVMTFSY